MMFRVTQQMQQRASMTQIQGRQRDLYIAQKQISSGYRFEKPSEDPLATGISMDLSKAIAFHERMKKNAETAADFNMQADHELGTAEEVMQRVRELALKAANEGLSPPQLDGIGTEIEGLIGRLSDIGNAVQEGNYIFGGYKSQQPPFLAEKNLSLEGTALTDLNLTRGTYKTRVETQTMSAVPAGSLALQGGQLIINGVDIGSFNVTNPARTAEENALALVERINAQTAKSGVTARAIRFPTGTFDAPGGAPLTGIALANLNEAGEPSGKPIEISGTGMIGTGNLNLFRNETVSLADTRYTTVRLGGGTIGNVPAGTLNINGVLVNSAMTFQATNSPEQNAQEIARAINTISSQTTVFAETDGNGFLKLSSQAPFSISGAPGQLEISNQTYEQVRNATASGGAVSTGSALTLSKGSLILNGIDIFSRPLVLDASLTAAQRAERIVVSINDRVQDTGIKVSTDGTGRLYFSNGDSRITSINYIGDAGENQAQIGRLETLALNMSGDKAFSGNSKQTRLFGGIDIPAAGVGSAVSTANVTFQAGDTLAAGEFVINGTNILAGPLTGAAAADAGTVIAAINAQSGTTGVSAAISGASGIQLTATNGSPFVLQTSGNGIKTQIPATAAGVTYLNGINAGDLLINGVDIGAIGPIAANPLNPPQNMIDVADAFINAINAQTARTGVNAERVTSPNTGGTRILLTATGQDIRVASNNPIANALFNTIGIETGTVVRQKIDAFDSLIRLRNQVLNGKTNSDYAETISVQNLQEVTDALDGLISNRVELGVRGKQAEMVQSRVNDVTYVLNSQLADQREVDLTEVITKLSLQEKALEASYNLTQRMIGMSLLNYL
jgi:flagellin-like hook-associated protein FlgL